MRRGALILALILAACSGAEERAPDTPPTGAVAAAPAPTPAPTSAAKPVDCGDERNGGYDNAKVCYYDQCNKGDAEACRMAESFNGNLYPTYLLDTVDCGDGSGTGPRHTKSCWIAACRAGNRDACDIAESDRPLHVIFGVSPGSQKLESMAYIDAREEILSMGWRPVEGPCSGGGVGESCPDFPEVGNCQGTGIAYCDMTFRRADRCLVVVTTGGYPSRTSPDDTNVAWVRFHKAPCKKDPNDP